MMNRRRMAVVGGWLSAGVFLVGMVVPAGEVDAVGERSVRADVYDFTLRPTQRARGARAHGRLHLPVSPFGIAVNREGFLQFDLELRIDGLRPAATLGPFATYAVWMTTPELDRTRKLGNVPASGVLRVRFSDFNKFILIVTAEASEDTDERRGPVMLRGVSPSGLLTSFGQHELFSTMPHE